MNSPKIKNFIGVLLATVLGAGIAWSGSQGSIIILGIPLFLLAIMVVFFIQWIAFIIAFKQKSERFFDLTGSLTYIFVTTITAILFPQIEKRSLLLLTLVVIWATRLGTFLFTRIQMAGRDDRFDEIKVDFSRFLLTWTIQGLWVTFTAAAALGAITSTNQKPLGWIALVGLVIWVIGFAFELLADVQKSAFKGNPENKGKFIQSGLWAWSRHPNYFGEILIWVGVAIIALPVLRGWALLTLISPVWVTLQLTLISGIPMLEKKADQRWGDEVEYQQYKTNTPILIPRPPAKRK